MQKNTFKISLFFLALIIQGCRCRVCSGSLESIEPPSGKYDIGTQVYFWTDNSRGELYTTDSQIIEN